MMTYDQYAKPNHRQLAAHGPTPALLPTHTRRANRRRPRNTHSANTPVMSALPPSSSSSVVVDADSPSVDDVAPPLAGALCVSPAVVAVVAAPSVGAGVGTGVGDGVGSGVGSGVGAGVGAFV